MTTTISGNGSIGGLAPGGLPSAVVQQPNLAAGVAGNGPAFTSYMSAATFSVAHASFTKLPVNAKDFDTGPCFDTANSRFQPNVPGYYMFTGAVSWVSASTGMSFASLSKNGSEVRRGTVATFGATSTVTAAVQGLIYLNGTTDYVELYGYQTTGSPLNAAGGNSVNTHLSGVLARAA